MAKFLFWGSISVEKRATAAIAEHERMLYDAEARLSAAENDVAAHKKEIARLTAKTSDAKHLHIVGSKEQLPAEFWKTDPSIESYLKQKKLQKSLDTQAKND